MKQKNLFQRMAMPLPELEEYYRERRKECFESGAPFGGVKLRKALHPVLVRGLTLMNLLSGQKITVIGDKRSPTHRPIIYASTHIGWDDPAIALYAIRDHAYMFWGDPKYSYKTMDGFLLDLNGIIVCHTDIKSDRYIGKETCVQWLQQGGNLLIFSEGAWNVTDHLPVMPLFAGTAEMAIRTGAEIVPLAFEKYGKHYLVNIGKNILPTDFALSQKQELTDILRDSLATLKWEIWARTPLESRRALPDGYREQYLQGFLDQITDESYSMEVVEATRFHTKADIAQKEVEAHLDKLIPRKENAFLFRKRN